MQRVVYLCLLFELVVLIGLVEASDRSGGYMQKVTGTVNVIRENASLTGNYGMKVYAGDTISTGRVSSTGVAFDDGTELTIGASTELEIERYMFEPEKALYEFSVIIKKGEILYNSGKISNLAPEKVNVKTPRATVEMKGSRFILAVK